MTVGILKEAIKNAEKSTYVYRIGCVIFRSKRIISSGFNQIRTSQKIPVRYKSFVETLHAEHHAIMRVDNKSLLEGASLLVIRLNKRGELLLSFPCQNCLRSIKHFKFKDIYYSNENGEIIRKKL